MIKKVKIRDLTEEQQVEYCVERNGNCLACPFCLITFDGRAWACARKLAHSQLSDNLLDQEVEIEVPDILTKEEHDYLEVVIKPFKEMIGSIIKLSSIKVNECQLVFRSLGLDTIIGRVPYVAGNFKGMEDCVHYTLEELGL